MKDVGKIILTILLAVLIAMPVAYAIIDVRTTYPVDGVKSIRLVGRCELDYFDDKKFIKLQNDVERHGC